MDKELTSPQQNLLDNANNYLGNYNKSGDERYLNTVKAMLADLEKAAPNNPKVKTLRESLEAAMQISAAEIADIAPDKAIIPETKGKESRTFSTKHEDNLKGDEAFIKFYRLIRYFPTDPTKFFKSLQNLEKYLEIYKSEINDEVIFKMEAKIQEKIEYILSSLESIIKNIEIYNSENEFNQITNLVVFLENREKISSSQKDIFLGGIERIKVAKGIEADIDVIYIALLREIGKFGANQSVDTKKIKDYLKILKDNNFSDTLISNIENKIREIESNTKKESVDLSKYYSRINTFLIPKYKSRLINMLNFIKENNFQEASKIYTYFAQMGLSSFPLLKDIKKLLDLIEKGNVEFIESQIEGVDQSYQDFLGRHTGEVKVEPGTAPNFLVTYNSKNLPINTFTKPRNRFEGSGGGEIFTIDGTRILFKKEIHINPFLRENITQPLNSKKLIEITKLFINQISKNRNTASHNELLARLISDKMTPIQGFSSQSKDDTNIDLHPIHENSSAFISNAGTLSIKGRYINGIFMEKFSSEAEIDLSNEFQQLGSTPKERTKRCLEVYTKMLDAQIDLTSAGLINPDKPSYVVHEGRILMFDPGVLRPITYQGALLQNPDVTKIFNELEVKLKEAIDHENDNYQKLQLQTVISNLKDKYSEFMQRYTKPIKAIFALNSACFPIGFTIFNDVPTHIKQMPHSFVEKMINTQIDVLEGRLGAVQLINKMKILTEDTLTSIDTSDFIPWKQSQSQAYKRLQALYDSVGGDRQKLRDRMVNLNTES